MTHVVVGISSLPKRWLYMKADGEQSSWTDDVDDATRFNDFEVGVSATRVAPRHPDVCDVVCIAYGFAKSIKDFAMRI